MIAKRGVKILQLLLQLEQDDRKQRWPDSSGGRDNYTTPKTNGDYGRENGSGDLPLDIHRLIVRAFYDQECFPSSDASRTNLHDRHREREHSTSNRIQSSSSTFQAPWPWSDSMNINDTGKERAYMDSVPVPQRALDMNGSLEDILFLAQNGCPS